MPHASTRPSIATSCFGLLIAGLLTSHAQAQSLNIRFGTNATTPSSSYAAAGLPGVWNSFLVTPDYGQQPLVSLAGTPISARYYQYGSSSMLTFNNPLTSGDDEKLMDSMIMSTNSPVDGCFWVQGLLNGPYEVTIYAMTPNDPTRLCRTRVDFATPGPVMVGGTWPGQHQSGITYARFNITISGGVIAFHDGLYNGYLQSGMNAVQFKFLGTCPLPTYSLQPTSTQVCQGEASFTATAAGTGPFAYRWQWQPPGNTTTWFDLEDGPMLFNGSVFGIAGGVRTNRITVSGVADLDLSNENARFQCIAANACGGISSNSATLTICFADFNCDQVVDFFDYLDFVSELSSQSPAADFNADTVIDFFDYLDFVQAFSDGC